MLAADPSISFATSGIIMYMCRIIGNIRRNIVGENTAIGTTEITVIEATGNTVIGTIINVTASKDLSKIAMETEPYFSAIRCSSFKKGS